MYKAILFLTFTFGAWVFQYYHKVNHYLSTTPLVYFVVKRQNNHILSINIFVEWTAVDLFYIIFYNIKILNILLNFHS